MAGFIVLSLTGRISQMAVKIEKSMLRLQNGTSVPVNTGKFQANSHVQGKSLNVVLQSGIFHFSYGQELIFILLCRTGENFSAT